MSVGNVKMYVLWIKLLCAPLSFSFDFCSLITLLRYVKHDVHVNVKNNNIPIQDYLHPDDHVPPTYNNNNIIIIYSIYRALIPNGPKALYIIKITKS